MSFFTHWFAQILLIQLNDVRVLMRFTNRLVLIFPIDSHLPLFQHLGISMVVRLPSTANATAGAAHNFNGMKLTLTRFNILKQTPRISQTQPLTDNEGIALKKAPILHPNAILVP